MRFPYHWRRHPQEKVENVSRLIELYRNSVQQWEVDMMGHMNVQFYVQKSTAALAVLAQELGLAPRDLRDSGACLVPLDHHIRFLKEQRPGAPVVINGGVIAATPERLTVYQEMVNAASEDVVATFQVTAQLQDARTRSPRQLPGGAVDRARALITDVPEHGAPRGLDLHAPRPAPTVAEAEQGGMKATWRGPVLPARGDAHGYLATDAHMGIVSDAVPNLLVRLTREDRSQGRIGGAALEYRFVYRQPARVDDLLTLYSGIRTVGTKAYQFGHWLFDASSGEVIATAEAVAVLLDLDARKAITIPEDRRSILEAHIVPGLSA